jgi:signal transduction histidine kinase
MMIVITNIVTIILLLGTILVLAYKFKMHGSKSWSQLQLFFSFMLLIIGTVSDTLYHLGYGILFDTYGEYINLSFFPIIIFSIFTFLLNRELEKKKQSEVQLQHQNEEYFRMNKMLLESNEEIRKINEALKKTNMELDSFVYRVSHDLRSPISTSMGLIDLSIESTDMKEIKHYLSLQETSLKRLDQFIKDILDYSKNIHLELVSQVVDFNELIDTAFLDYRNPDAGNIELIKELDVAVPFSNNVFRMRIIFNNLISNAIKFQNEGQTDHRIEVRVHTTPEAAHISIRDNGIGIQDKFQKDVFKIFFRAASKHTGSGLGLYIVNDCIQKINGSIELTSNYKEGTTMLIVIPNIPPTAD